MYYFMDYDDITETDLTISGSDYIQLINVCFRYSTTLSLCFPSLELANKFSKKTEMLCYTISENSDLNRKYKCYFPCSDLMKELLLSNVNDLFDWVQHDGKGNPEDLTFYREDGSVFLWSETHEGICVLCNHMQENVSLIVSKNGWNIRKKGEFILGIPQYLFMNDVL